MYGTYKAEALPVVKKLAVEVALIAPEIASSKPSLVPQVKAPLIVKFVLETLPTFVCPATLKLEVMPRLVAVAFPKIVLPEIVRLVEEILVLETLVAHKLVVVTEAKAGEVVGMK